MSDEFEIYDDKKFKPKLREGLSVDTFKFGELKKGVPKVIVVGDNNKHTVRTRLNQHRNHWQKKTGLEYGISYGEDKGKEVFRIFIKDKK